jgi:hypothetical protein
MKIAISLLLCLLLSACASESGDVGPSGSPAPAPAPRPVPGPQPEAELSWGMLKCQKQENCQDPVLNLRVSKIKYFFATKRNPKFEGEAAPFLCGRWLGQVWTEEMGSDGFDPRVGEFLLQNYDLKDCRGLAVDLKTLNNFLQNHQEYKNESR